MKILPDSKNIHNNYVLRNQGSNLRVCLCIQWIHYSMGLKQAALILFSIYPCFTGAAHGDGLNHLLSMLAQICSYNPCKKRIPSPIGKSQSSSCVSLLLTCYYLTRYTSDTKCVWVSPTTSNSLGY